MDPQLAASIAGRPSALGLYAPSPVYVTGEEALRLTTFGNTAGLTVTLRARMLTPGGVIIPSAPIHVPNSNRTAASTVLQLSEGWLLGVDAPVTGGSPLGNGLWGVLELVRGSGAQQVALQMLTSDFITANSPLFWPSETFLEPMDGAGCLRSIVGTTPGAGAEISETVPSNARWELLSLVATLTSAVAVANRVPALLLDDGANVYYETSDQQNQAASLAWDYIFAQGLTFKDSGNRLQVSAPIPSGIKLSAGHRIRTNTLAIQAADQWSSPKYLVREWFDV